MNHGKLAQSILERLFEGSRIKNINFGCFPQLLFVEKDAQRSIIKRSIKGQVYLELWSNWEIVDSLPSTLPNSEDDFPKYSENEQIKLLDSIKNAEIIEVKLGSKQPHLIFTFENDKIFIVNGISNYECWQAGLSQNPKHSCQIIAGPTGLSIWAPKAFLL